MELGLNNRHLENPRWRGLATRALHTHLLSSQ